ncbi:MULTISPECIES: porin family protein [Niastella]|uniref:PorT family protein n=1 Tax=Niastella soli TaxID=2821487 RepID=A0ABS3YSM8_9BACT|nr:porin family protein [Niastella soli]MBO9200885.1 PorT family protein [Niastella soli]
MKTKVLLFALTTTVFALGAKAQDKTTFGVRAGVNFQNINGDDGAGHDYDYKMKTGFNIGVNAEIPLAPQFYVQPGLLFSTKGAKQEVANTDDIKLNLSYLEVPINLLFKPELGAGKLLLGFGPYVGIAVGGKVKQGSNDVDIEFENDVKSTNLKPTLKRVDFGGNLLAGYELSSKLSFQLNAQLGMSNLEPKVDGKKPEAKTKNTGFGFSVGYRF